MPAVTWAIWVSVRCIWVAIVRIAIVGVMVVVGAMCAIRVVRVMCAVVVGVMWSIRVVRVMDTIWVIACPVIRMEATWSMSSLSDSVRVCGVVCAGVSPVVLNWAVVDAGVAVWGVKVSVFVLHVVSESVVSVIKLCLSENDGFFVGVGGLVSIVTAIVVHAPASIVWEVTTVVLG